MTETIGELLGEIKGETPDQRLLDLIRFVLIKLAPGRRWFVDRSILNDRIDVTLVDGGGMRGTSILLYHGDIGYWIYHTLLVLTHHREWHKGFSIGSVTVNPYPPLQDQLEYLAEYPEQVDMKFNDAGVTKEIAEIRELV